MHSSSQHLALLPWPTAAGVPNPALQTLLQSYHELLLLPQMQGGAGVSLLQHPLAPPQPVVADVGARQGQQGALTGWAGEQLVWAAVGDPHVATFCKVLLRDSTERLE